MIKLYDELVEMRLQAKQGVRDDILSRASVYELANNITKAMADYEYLIHVHPSDSEPYSRAAELLLNCGKPEKALLLIEKSIELAMSNIYNLELRSKIYAALGREQEAEVDRKAVADYHEQEAAKWNDPNHYYNYK